MSKTLSIPFQQLARLFPPFWRASKWSFATETSQQIRSLLCRCEPACFQLMMIVASVLTLPVFQITAVTVSADQEVATYRGWVHAQVLQGEDSGPVPASLLFIHSNFRCMGSFCPCDLTASRCQVNMDLAF
jgi:hypothetical protein